MILFNPRHLWVGSVFVAVLALGLRAELSAADELRNANIALDKGAVNEAIEHFQYALHWHAPFSQSAHEAVEALQEIANQARRDGDRGTELKALRRLRGGILATRSFATDYSDQLPTINLQLAKVTAVEQLALGGPTIGGRSQSELEAHHLSLLQLDPAPDSFWALVVVLAFLSWVSLIVLTITRGFDAALSIQQPFFFRASSGAIVSFVIWLLALTRA